MVLERKVQQIVRVNLAENEHVTGDDVVVLPLEIDLAVVSTVAKRG